MLEHGWALCKTLLLLFLILRQHNGGDAWMQFHIHITHTDLSLTDFGEI